MKTAIIRSSWVVDVSNRLDCKPYVGGVLETKALLRNLKDTVPLESVTKGHDGGIYSGPQFVRTYVDDPKYGVPFITGGSMHYADLSDLPLLSKRDALSPKLSYLEVQPGMSLISCSGSKAVGKMAYARPDMKGAWSCQDVIKVVANPDRIPSGYLYAFLSSKFGVPLLKAGTYGSAIPHLEPHQIADLPVPRLPDAIEQKIHRLVEQAGNLRATANTKKKAAIASFFEGFGLPPPTLNWDNHTPHIGEATAAHLGERMDSTYYISSCVEARAVFDAASRLSSRRTLGEVAEVFIPTIFKRVYAPDPDFGIPYITGADVFCIQPKSDQYLLHSIAKDNRLVLESGMLLIHEAGSRYGLIGRTAMVGRMLKGCACTNNMVRLIPHDPDDAGYIYAALSSDVGIRLLKREAAGSAIPHIDAARVRAVSIPWPEKATRRKVATLAHTARDSWDEADELEQRAVQILIRAIEESV